MVTTETTAKRVLLQAFHKFRSHYTSDLPKEHLTETGDVERISLSARKHLTGIDKQSEWVRSGFFRRFISDYLSKKSVSNYFRCHIIQTIVWNIHDKR